MSPMFLFGPKYRTYNHVYNHDGFKEKDCLLVKENGIYLMWKVGTLEENMDLKNAM